jgi:hypothetical protein
MNNNQVSMKPCPICQQMMFITGTDGKKKITSCGHKFRFKLTKSQKDMARKYIRTEYGLELAPISQPNETEKTNVEPHNTSKTER